MNRREFVSTAAAISVSAAIPALPLPAEPLSVFTNGRDYIIAPTLLRAKEILAELTFGKPLEEMTPQELVEYIDPPEPGDAWEKISDLDAMMDIGDDDGMAETAETKTWREWIADEGEGYLCISSFYC